MKAFFITLILISLPLEHALAVNATDADDANYHNIIRTALSRGQTLNNLGAYLTESYDFSKQNRPAGALPPLTNSNGQKGSAATSAARCTFSHTRGGENLFVGTEPNTMTASLWLSSRNWRIENAVNHWAFEARLMVYPKDSLTVSCYDDEQSLVCGSGAIGHYTQMIWNPSGAYAYSATREVGCAAHYCPTGIADPNNLLSSSFDTRKATMIACHYDPKGNYTENGNYVAPYDGIGIRSITNGVPLSPIIGLLLSD